MPSPFPGMDPYLEDAEIWSGFHHSIAEEIKRRLNRQLGPKYYAEVEVLVVAEHVEVGISGPIIPDAAVLEAAMPAAKASSGASSATAAIPAAPIRRPVPVPDEVKLRSVRIYRTPTNRLVTSIEILSPFNKRSEGLEKYRQKRARLLQSPVHLVEIDFLRGGERPGREVAKPPLATDYVVLVNRGNGWDVRESEIWPVSLSEQLPTLPIPLLVPDPDQPLHLEECFRAVYDDSRYAPRLDYRRPIPPPAIRPEMRAWLKENLPTVGAVES